MVILKDEKVEHKHMPCSKEGCKYKALSLSNFCWKHIPDKEKYKEEVANAVKNKKTNKFNLRKSVLRDIELAKADFSGANLTQADLSSSNLFDTNLSGADLVGTDFSGSDLTGADLTGADLTKANLRGARLWHADLTNAKLVEADLCDADVWQAKLGGARLWRTDISKAKSLTKKNFQQSKNKFVTTYQIHQGGFVAAEETYRRLKRYFMNEGRYDDASWASFKEKTMEVNRLKEARDWSFIPVALMGLLCGYGEKPYRVVLSSSFIIFIYALLFYFFKTAVPSAASKVALNFWDYIYYSVVTFTTLGYGDIVPKASTVYRLLAASEAFLGAFLMGLFIFTLARKYSAR